MITLQENYPVDRIGQEAHDNVEEHNRVMSNLKLLVQSMLENGKDAEDIAALAWHCGFEYATSYYIAKDQLKINDKKA